jgi:exodeoxyribonuclease VII large subunit
VGDSSQLDLTFQAPLLARRIWTVRDLLARVRTELEREYTDIWVEGEISNFRKAESGHLYFTLKDDGAQIRIVMFRTQARLLRFRPEDGLQVIARGRVTVYESRGELQLSAEYLEPRGAGALQIAFEQLKQKLAAEGLFDQARKKPIPALPRRIGVVTSPRGAAIQDIVNILRRRHESAHVLIYPAQVQGEAAPREVAAGLRWFNRARNVDVIIVARGGGSIEDLAAFNDEALARVVAASELPVIAAIGHETDFTIVDFVADLRAPTPSAAAELVIRSKHEVEEQLGALARRLIRASRYQLLMARQRLTQLAQHGAFARIADVLGRRQQALDDLTYRLTTAHAGILQQHRRRLDIATARLRSFDVRRRLTAVRRELDARLARLAAAARTGLMRRRNQLDQLSGRLHALSPLNILERGYALVFDAAGNLVKDSSQVRVGDELSARLARGTLGVTVRKKS